MVPTLIPVSMLAFALAEWLPGDMGRSVLGPYASQKQVEMLDHKLGADRPLSSRCAPWSGGFVTGDWGESSVLHVPE